MPSGYQTFFGGNPIAPAIPTYLPLTFSVNTVLGWPLESNITSPAVAEWIDCTATAPALTLQLSDARQVSTGYTTILNNVGANTFSVLDAQGNTLMAPASGAAWILVLSDNSTLQGTWRALQLGAGVSVANAASLAGNGLKAITTLLNSRIVINPQAANYLMQVSDRAACVEWIGGSGGNFVTQTPTTLGSDWFCYIKNSGTGALTLSAQAGTIDNAGSTKVFNPGDSCILATDGTNFFTIGFGQSVASSFSFVTIGLAGASGTIVLAGAQLNRISYRFTGALAGNVVIQVPASIQQYWVDNETTGAFTLTVSAGGAGTTVPVPQANRMILYCDGLNIVSAVSAGSIQFADGTAAAPSITWASHLTTGLYLAGADNIGITTAGTQRGSVNSAGQWTLNTPASGNTLTLNGLTGASALQINAGGNGPNDDVFITGNANAISQQLFNASAGQATCNISCGNNLSNFVVMEITGGGWTGSIISGAPAGPAALMGSTGNIPLLIMSNHTVAAVVSAGQNWTFPAPAGAGNTVQISGPTGNLALFCIGSNATGQSFGIAVNGGTNSSDYALLCQNAAAVPVFKVRGDGIIMGAGPTAGLTDMTPDQGTFTGTLTGGTTAPTMTVTWYKIGKKVTLSIPGQSLTSNATTFTMTGVPVELQPATLTTQSSPVLQGTNNGAQAFTVNALISSGSGTITFTLNGGSTNWTNAGTKAINAFDFTYLLI